MTSLVNLVKLNNEELIENEYYIKIYTTTAAENPVSMTAAATLNAITSAFSKISNKVSFSTTDLRKINIIKSDYTGTYNGDIYNVFNINGVENVTIEQMENDPSKIRLKLTRLTRPQNPYFSNTYDLSNVLFYDIDIYVVSNDSNDRSVIRVESPIKELTYDDLLQTFTRNKDGGSTLVKTDERVKLGNITRIVYKGKNGAKFVKMSGGFVALKDARKQQKKKEDESKQKPKKK